MKKTIVLAAFALCFSAAAFAQRPKLDLPDYEFSPVVENPVTSVKNQASSGTCWAFSTISFVESEIIRINHIKDTALFPDLSEFFVVSHSYSERADKYVRLDGKLQFAAGSEADDVLHVIKDYGMVPQAEMTGMNYGYELPAQSELDAVLKAYIEAVAKVPNRNRLTTAWKKGFDGILEAYLGKYPETFTVDGVVYTPASYRDALKFNPDDYVTITSFTHHPFYTKFAIEVCDNWRWDEAYNVPIDEFMNIIDKALNDGYTLAWGADVSAPGFTRDGHAFFIEAPSKASGSDQKRWTGEDGQAPEKVSPTEMVPSQEQRQADFDRKILTDDHGMQIYGIATDQFGAKYYMVKNSWGDTGKYHGIWYATEAFVKGQSLDVMVHKSALSSEMRKKLGIK